MDFGKTMMGVLACVVFALGLVQSVHGAPTEEERQLKEEFFSQLKKSEDLGMKKEALIHYYTNLGKKMKQAAKEHRNAAEARDRIINKKDALTRGEMDALEKANDFFESLTDLHDFLESAQELSIKNYAVLSKIDDLETSLQKGKISKMEYNQERQALLGEVRYIEQQLQERELAYTLAEVIRNLNRPLWEVAHKKSIQCNMN